VKLRPVIANLDAWLDPTWEVLLGCVVLVLSAAFWTSNNPSAISDAGDWATNLGAIVVGPMLVYRAWKRRRGNLRCGSCGERVDVTDEYDHAVGFLFYVVHCPRCGPYAVDRVSSPN
jgi:hypothetical protein